MTLKLSVRHLLQAFPKLNQKCLDTSVQVVRSPLALDQEAETTCGSKVPDTGKDNVAKLLFRPELVKGGLMHHLIHQESFRANIPVTSVAHIEPGFHAVVNICRVFQRLLVNVI